MSNIIQDSNISASSVESSDIADDGPEVKLKIYEKDSPYYNSNSFETYNVKSNENVEAVNSRIKNYSGNSPSESADCPDTNVCINTEINNSTNDEICVKSKTIEGEEVFLIKTCDQNSNEESESCDSKIVKEYYICDVCRRQFSSKSSLSVHYGCHPQTNIHKCYLCEETFVQATDFADHLAEHCYDEFDCITCDESFTNKALLDAHTQNHALMLKQHECDVCQSKFSTEMKLNEHHRNHSTKPHRCLICAKTFRLKSSLNRHILIHGNTKPFQCKICHRGFTQKITLKKHYLGHEKIKPFTCELCPRSFTSKPSLQLHYVNHSGEKPYNCLVCDRGFTSRRNLKRHGMEHMPGQRSSCDICGKVFPTKSKLNLHILVHTNDRPFKCDLCNRGFTYSSHLKRHKMWHNGERPFICDICGKDFPTRFRLTGHLEKHAEVMSFEPYVDLCVTDVDELEVTDIEDLEIIETENVEIG